MKNLRRKFFFKFFFDICVQLLAPFKAYRLGFDFEIRYSRPLSFIFQYGLTLFCKSWNAILHLWYYLFYFSFSGCFSSKFPQSNRLRLWYNYRPQSFMSIFIVIWILSSFLSLLRLCISLCILKEPDVNLQNDQHYTSHM